MSDNIDDLVKNPSAGINLKDPVVRLCREILHGYKVKEVKSDLYCPSCNSNLPYNTTTVRILLAGQDATGRSKFETWYYCTGCNSHFDKK